MMPDPSTNPAAMPVDGLDDVCSCPCTQDDGGPDGGCEHKTCHAGCPGHLVVSALLLDASDGDRP